MNQINLKPIPFKTIPADVNFEQARIAWRRNCEKMSIHNSASHILSEKQIQAYHAICSDYKKLLKSTPEPISDQQFYTFIKEKFDLFQITKDDQESGLLTGYFQPDLQVNACETPIYKYPIYTRPRDLVVIEDAGILNPSARGIRIAGRLEKGTLVPYATHAEIIMHGLTSQAEIIAWCNNYMDLFFAHIQGSARLNYPDGSVQHIFYDGTNGHRYTTIGRYMVDQGWLDKDTVSMQTIKSWLKKNPEYQNEVLTQNKSYIFFKISPDPHGPIGAFNTVLTPEATIAIDPLFVPLGCMLWLDAVHPIDDTGRLQRLVLAQDIGGVIKGPLRADFYWGSGDHAAENAGVMKSQANFYMLLPKEINL